VNKRIEARRQKIMDAALEVFREEGFERASIDKIVARSGGSKATLYKLFNNKEGLFFAILRRAAERIGEREHSLLRPVSVEALREVLIGIGHGLVDNVLNEDIISLYQLAVEATRHNPDLARLYFEGGPKKARDDFALFLDDLRKAGLLQFEDSDLAARCFFGMILDRHHLAMSLGMAGTIGEAEADRLINEAVDVFLAAYGRTGEQARAL